MRSIVKVAVRNTRRQLKRSVLLGGAIAFGLLVITLVNAFTAGISANVRESFSYAFGGHIFVDGSAVSDSGRVIGRIDDDTALRRLLETAELPVVSVHRRSRTFAALIFGSKQASERIDGVDFAAESDLAKGLQITSGGLEGLADENAIILSSAAADRLGVQVGETVLIRLVTVTGQHNVGELRIAAIAEDVGSFGLSTSYVNLRYLNALLGLRPDEYQLLNLFLADMRTIDSVAERVYQGLQEQGVLVERPLAAALGNMDEMSAEGQEAFGRLFGFSFGGASSERWTGTKYSVTTLNELLQPVQATLTVLDTIAMVIFLILLVITMVGITNTFRMVLIERTREIGTMRAFGMQRKTVRRIFLTEAAVIALGGGVAGIALAGIAAAILGRVSFAHVDGLQFFLHNGHFSLPLRPGSVVTNLLILVGMSLLAAYMPARAAARLEPVKALGSHF